MCSICGHVPCLSRFPNAPAPPAIYTCKVCGEPIRAGDDYYELDGQYDTRRLEAFLSFLDTLDYDLALPGHQMPWSRADQLAELRTHLEP